MNDLILVSILEAMQRADELICNSGLCKLLQGRDNKNLRRYGLDHIPEFGVLAHIEKSEIQKRIDELIERGCLNVSIFFTLRINEIGRNRLERLLKKTPGHIKPDSVPQGGNDIVQVCNELDFWEFFSNDLTQAQNSVIIVSPFISEYRARLILPELLKLTKRNINVLVYMRPADRVKEKEAIKNLQELGIEIVFRENIHQKIAVIDNNIAWSGSLNILQHIKSHELMTRHSDPEFAKNLLEIMGVV